MKKTKKKLVDCYNTILIDWEKVELTAQRRWLFTVDFGEVKTAPAEC